MNLYLDASAFCKRYIVEPGSSQIRALIELAAALAASPVARVEVTAALTRAVRIKTVSQNRASAMRIRFQHDWQNCIRIEVSDVVIEQAEVLAWNHGLRGYDAVHLASALLWQEMLNEVVVMVTFDRQLWSAAQHEGLSVYPQEWLVR